MRTAKLKERQEWRQQGILGSVFRGSVEVRNGRIFPLIRGSAHVTLRGSLIIDENDPIRVGDQVSGSRPYDVAVVGGGIIGCACAFNLRRAGLGVLLIDRGVPSNAASMGQRRALRVWGGAAGVRLPRSGRRCRGCCLRGTVPFGFRYRASGLLAPWLARFASNTRPSQVERATSALASLLAPAPAAWRRLAEAAHLTDLIRTSPLLVVARSQAALVSKRPSIEVSRRHGTVIDEISTSEARQIEPLIRPDVAGAFVYRQAQYTTDPAKLTRRLKEAYVEAGGHAALDDIGMLETPGRWNGQSRLLGSPDSASLQRESARGTF